MKDKNSNSSDRLRNKNFAKYFLKVMLIAFIPVVVIDVVITALLKGQHQWIVWLVTLVLLVVVGSIGLYILKRKAMQEREEYEQNKRNGKKIINKEDIDIFS